MRFRISLTKLDVLISNVDTLFTLRVLQTRKLLLISGTKSTVTLSEEKICFKWTTETRRTDFYADVMTGSL